MFFEDTEQVFCKSYNVDSLDIASFVSDQYLTKGAGTRPVNGFSPTAATHLQCLQRYLSWQP